MSDNFRERFGNGVGIREIPPTTIEGRVTALECKVKDLIKEVRQLTAVILAGGDVK